MSRAATARRVRASFRPRGAAHVALLGALCAQAALAGDPPSFPRAMYPTADVPRRVALADLDGDGRLDAVTAHAGQVAWLLALPGGGFGAPQTLPAGPDPSDVAAGDLDADGAADLLVLDKADDLLRIYLSAGGGSFAPAVAIAAGPDPLALAVADIDADGRLDVALGNSAASSAENVWFLAGLGDGGFEPPVKLSTNQPVRDLAAGDVNGDGFADVAISCVATLSDPVALFVYLGWAGGLPNGAFEFEWAGTLGEIALADFNLDGRMDVSCVWDAGGSVLVSLAKATGGFKPWFPVPVPSNTKQLVVADFSRDGIPDMVTTGSAPGRASIALGIGNGTFAEPIERNVSALDLAAGDADGDGFDDLVLCTNTSPGFVSVWSSTEDGGFGAFDMPMTPTQAGALLAADVDGDGRDDLVATRLSPAAATVRLAAAAGGFLDPVTYPVAGSSAWDLVSSDLDLDGDLDLAVQASVATTVLLNAGDGSFVAQPSLGFGGAAIEAGALDGDDDADLCLLDVGFDGVRVLVNEGGGVFAPGAFVSTGAEADDLALADHDGDRLLDAIVADHDNDRILVLHGDGEGGFASSTDIPVASAGGTGPLTVAAADVDADGDIDLIVELLQELVLLRGTGAGGVAPPETLWTQVGLDFRLGALDDDGDLDLLLASTQHDHAALLNDGRGGFQLAGHFGAGTTPRSPVIGDFDGDGSKDLASLQGLTPAAYSLDVCFGSGGTSWDDLGFALAGAAGAPRLLGLGPPAPGQHVSFELSNAAASAPGALFVGVLTLNVPFKGGTLVPDYVSSGLMLPIATGPAGSWSLAITWPSVPAGVPLHLQAWLVDASGPVGFAASNAIAGTTAAP